MGDLITILNEIEEMIHEPGNEIYYIEYASSYLKTVEYLCVSI